jgi:hypothetical protein
VLFRSDTRLFNQYHKSADLDNQIVVAKIFNPYGNGVWYLLNSDPQDPDYIWAIVDLFEVEMGSVSRSELEGLKVPPFNLPLERDLYFTPMNAKSLYNDLLKGKRYAEGGLTSTEVLISKDGDAWLFPQNPDGEDFVIKLEDGGEINWGEDLGGGFTVGTDVHITDSKSLFKGKTGFISGLAGKDLMVTILDNGNERNVVVSKKGVEKLDAPEFARGGKIGVIKKDQEYKYWGRQFTDADVFDRIKGQVANYEFAGNFRLKNWKHDGYLYFIDESDESYLIDTNLKKGEAIFRYYTYVTAIGGMMPLIKINVEKMLAYPMEHKDFGDESVSFVTKGMDFVYLNLVEDVKYSDGGYMQDGGEIKDKFRGKNSKEVWNDLDFSTRAKVLEYL